MSMNASVPILSASLSLSSATHSFSSDNAPLLNLTITSHYHSTIIIYCDDLSPALLIRHGALEITDLTTGLEVKQSKRTRCIFEPPTKIEVKLNEDLFLELPSGEPVTLSAPFSRNRKPLPRGAPGFEDATDAKNNHVIGVDGLEPGHHYLIQFSKSSRVHWQTVRWWEYGTKEEVLRPKADGTGLDARKVKFGSAPHEPIQIDVFGFTPLYLKCIEYDACVHMKLDSP